LELILPVRELTINLPIIIEIQKNDTIKPADCTSKDLAILKNVGDQVEITVSDRQ
jgi:hypothetical protein